MKNRELANIAIMSVMSVVLIPTYLRSVLAMIDSSGEIYHFMAQNLLVWPDMFKITLCPVLWDFTREHANTCNHNNNTNNNDNISLFSDIWPVNRKQITRSLYIFKILVHRLSFYLKWPPYLISPNSNSIYLDADVLET